MLVKLRDAAAGSCGGKAHALGSLLRAGLPIPDGVVVPFARYRAVKADLPTEIDLLCRAIGHSLEEFGDVPMAVRSSANTEDAVDASAAGQYDSVLGVRGIDSIMKAVQMCWASMHSDRATSYHSGMNGQQPERTEMAVIIQRLVDADVSGVLFTPVDPGGVTEIEAAWGLGTTVVGGTVSPDSYQIDEHGAVTAILADKRIRTDRNGTTLITSDVSAETRTAETLTDATAVLLTQLGRRIAELLGGPQDIEWAIADDRISILQARPITAALPDRRNTLAKSVIGRRADAPEIITGTPGSAGRASGPVRIVKGPSDFNRVRRGDILVCPHTDPAWTPLLRMAAGVVTEVGGVLSHAAIVARELGIPAILGVPNATDQLRNKVIITMDGAAGTITDAPTQFDGSVGPENNRNSTESRTET